MKKIEWLYVDAETNEVFCENCGGREKMPLPMPINAFGKWVEYISEKHKYCRKPGTKEGVR